MFQACAAFNLSGEKSGGKRCALPGAIPRLIVPPLTRPTYTLTQAPELYIEILRLLAKLSDRK